MLKLDQYEDEYRKRDGCAFCVVDIDVTESDGYTCVDLISAREFTFEEAKKIVLDHLVVLRDEINDLLERERR